MQQINTRYIIPVAEIVLLALLLSVTAFSHPSLSFAALKETCGVWYDVACLLLLFLPAWRCLPKKDDFKNGTWQESIVFFPLALLCIATLLSVRTGINLGNIFIIVASAYFLIKRRFRMPETHMWCFFAYFATLAVSLLWSSDTQNGLVLLRRSALWFALPLTFCAFSPDSRQWDTVLLAFFRAAFVFAALSLFSWIYASRQADVTLAEFFLPYKHDIGGGSCVELVYAWTAYRHPSYNALGLIIGLIAAQYLVRRKRITIVECVVYCAMTAVLCCITQSRVGLVMFAATVLMSVLFFLPARRSWRIGYIAVLVAVAVSALVWWRTVQSGFSLDKARQTLFYNAFEQIRLHPVLGVGLGSLPEALRDAKLSNPHNQILGDWLQSGLPALAALFAVLTSLIVRAVRRKNAELLLLMIVMLIFMQIEMPFYLLKGVTYFTVFACFFACRRSESEAKSASHATPNRTECQG